MSLPAALPPPVASLWPPPAQVAVGRSSVAGRLDYLVVPSLRRPRYLVPADVPAAERMLASHSGTRVDRSARAAWRRAQRAGVARRLPVSRLSVLPADDGIEAYLSDVVGQAVRIGILLGPPRANLKPVAQIFDATGTTIAFAKLGTTPLTADLLATETAALTMLSTTPTSTFRAPELLHHGTWKDTPVLVQRALALAQSDLAPRTAPLDVMVEIAGLRGVSTGRPTVSADEAYDDWYGIDMTAFGRLRDILGQAGEVAIGCWHGDFGPWNMGTDGRLVEVWDWERFAADVPVGLDAAHYRTQRAVAAQVDPSTAWDSICADVSAVLQAVDVDASTAPEVGGCYLLEIVARYRADAGTEPTPRLRHRMAWLAAVADRAASDLATRQTGHV